MIRWKDHHPIYLVWNAMKTRCNNPRRHNYKYYGGKGIGYSEDWATFENFCADMLPSWELGLQLDRIDNSKGYSKDNCRWVTPKQNSWNRDSNKLTFDIAEEIRRLYSTGKYTQRQLAKMFGVSPMTINRAVLRTQWRA